MDQSYPFGTVDSLANVAGKVWENYRKCYETTLACEKKARDALANVIGAGSLLPTDTSLVLCGSFARYEMNDSSDYDWSLLIDGVVDNSHAELSCNIESAFNTANLTEPGSSGVFGNLVFSHDLVHRIGGGADSNENLTRRMLMLIESRPLSFDENIGYDFVWTNTLKNILERYFEEDVHFATGGKSQVPRFLLNDLTRYWRTICVDYAAKHREQDGNKWAIRNAKLRFSRKLLYACGFAFCLGCHLNPPRNQEFGLFGEFEATSTSDFIDRAIAFAQTPPLEYLARFIESFVEDDQSRHNIADLIFGPYNSWLQILADHKDHISKLKHAEAESDNTFQNIRELSSKFARGLELLFFNYDRESPGMDAVASLSHKYIGF